MHLPSCSNYMQSFILAVVFIAVFQPYTSNAFNDNHMWNTQNLYVIEAKQILFNAKTEAQMDEALEDLVWFERSFYKPRILESLLKEVEEQRSYYELRADNKFDYGSLKKGFGLGMITALIAYGIYAVYHNWYKPNEDLKNTALADLEAMGIKKYEYTEHYFDHAMHRTEFWGSPSLDSWDDVRSKVTQWRNYENHSDAIRVTQLTFGTAAIVAGIAGSGYVYRGFTTNCKAEYERFCLIKSKIEQVQRSIAWVIV